MWQCAALHALCLRANRLTTEALGLDHCAAPLEVLDLGENRLGPAFPPLGSMVSLQHLHLPSNRIAQLPAEQVQGLAALQTLDIKENDVPTLPPQLSQLGRLTALGISGNPIRTVSHSVQQAGTAAVLALLAKRMPL